MRFPNFCETVLLFKNGAREDQAKMLFRIIDISDDTVLSKFELLKFFLKGVRDKDRKRAVSDVVNELMIMMDKDESGEVEREEFSTSIASEDEVWMLFEAINPFYPVIEKLNFLTVDGD